jgi:polar amino acid transport system substrate-binding protein
MRLFINNVVLLLLLFTAPVTVQFVQACEVEADSAVKGADCTQSIDYLVYGTSAEPLQIVEPSGHVSGFISDVINEIFAGSDISIIPVVKPIARHKGAMINGKAKRWIAYALNSWRQENVWSNATFADIEMLPYSLSLGFKDLGDWPPPMPAVDVNKLAELGVVWIRGFKYPGTAGFSDAYGFEFDRAKNHAAMLKMVEAGHVRYFMEHAPRMRYVMKKQGVDVAEYDFFSIAAYVPPTSLTLLMSNDLGEEVIALVNRRLKEMASSGRLAVLARSYKL